MVKVLLFNRQFSLYNLGLYESICDQSVATKVQFDFLFEYGPFSPSRVNHAHFSSIYEVERYNSKKLGVFFSLSLAKYIILNRYDLIILDEGSALNALLVLLLKPVLNTKLIIWGIGEIPGRNYSKGSRFYSRLLRKYIARRADSIIAYSEYSREVFKNWDIADDRIIKSLNVFDIGSYSTKKQNVNSIARSAEIVKFTQNPFIYYCGAIEPRKDHIYSSKHLNN